MRYDGKGALPIASHLQRIITSDHTTAEIELVQWALDHSDKTEHVAVVHQLCRVSYLWQDVSLWLDATRLPSKGGRLSRLRNSDLLTGISAHGFPKIVTT